ncbi:MAG: BPSL0067 family protein [Paracoccaceae bacterium]
MPYYAENLNEHIGKKYQENEAFGTTCVAYVKIVSGAPSTPNWRPQAKVFDPLNPQCFYHVELRPGVAIATFNSEGRYPDKDQHAAIFLGYTTRGFRVQEQTLADKKVVIREIFRTEPNEEKVYANDPNAYYVIGIAPAI